MTETTAPTSLRAALQRISDAAGRYINDYAEASPDVQAEIRRQLGEAQYDACCILQDDSLDAAHETETTPRGTPAGLRSTPASVRRGRR